ncbi:hypothetical protein ACFOJE_21175 [Azotobacter bryophylli]|uniref:Minor tail T domain-containing protein n=1 Tax=Azotobacter bryophylli TaxID=1986537 RepID=A0ABV7AYR1_9GAMM
MLNGIGGRTIVEAQGRISYPEFLQWMRYRRRRGSLNVGQRVEMAIASLSALYANAHRKEHAPAFKWYDFAPHHEEPELTLEQAMANWA